MKTEEQIAKDFGCGYDCAMQVAAELVPEVGLTEEQGLKIAACLGSVRCRDSCAVRSSGH